MLKDAGGRDNYTEQGGGCADGLCLRKTQMEKIRLVPPVKDVAVERIWKTNSWNRLQGGCVGFHNHYLKLQFYQVVIFVL